jgi:hypothetical protein
MKKYLLMLVGVLFVSTFLGNSVQAALGVNPGTIYGTSVIGFGASALSVSSGQTLIISANTTTDQLYEQQTFNSVLPGHCGLEVVDLTANLASVYSNDVYPGMTISAAMSGTYNFVSPTVTSTHQFSAALFCSTVPPGGPGGGSNGGVCDYYHPPLGAIGTDLTCAEVKFSVTPYAGPADAVAPVVTLASPSNDQVLDYLNIDAAATDNNATVTKMELYISSATTPVATTQNGSMVTSNQYLNTLPVGTFDITLKAYDPAGNIGVKTITGLTFKPRSTLLIGNTATTTTQPIFIDSPSGVNEFAGSGVPVSSSRAVRFYDGYVSATDAPIAETNIDLTVSRSLGTLSADSDPATFKSYMHGLATAPGVIGAKFDLYVPKDPAMNRVSICPGAQSLVEVKTDCANKVTYKEGDPEVSVVTVNGKQYWLVKGVTGTGGMNENVLGATTTVPPTTTPTTPAATTPAPTLAATGSRTKSVMIIGALVALTASYSVFSAYSRKSYKA